MKQNIQAAIFCLLFMLFVHYWKVDFGTLMRYSYQVVLVSGSGGRFEPHSNGKLLLLGLDH